MKQISRCLIVLVFCLWNVSILSGQNIAFVWEQKANFIGGKIEGAVTFSVGGKGYVCMATSGKDCWRYDPGKDTWKKMSDFPGEPRRGAMAFTIEDKVYLGTGAVKSENGNTDLKDIWEYDPVADHWEKKADFPGGPRHGAIAFSLGGKAYMGLGGQSGRSGNYNDLWEYNPKADKWDKKADLPETGRSNASIFLIKNDAYILFGEQGMEITVNKKEVYRYNTENNTWAKDVEFPGSPRTGATVFSLKNRGYVFAGCNGGNQRYDDFWEYNTTSHSWQQQNPDTLPSARNNAFCFVIDSTVYVGTGKIKGSILNSGTNDFWCANTQTNIDFKAKLLYKNKNNKRVPLAQQGISLVSQKKVLQTTTTDSTGAFGFKKLDLDKKYVVVLDKNDKLPSDAVVSIAKPSGKVVMNLEKNNDGQFAYEVSKMDLLDEDDSYFNLQYFMKSSDKDVTITSHINYATGSWDLTDAAKDILYQVIVSLSQYPNLIVVVSSHTDAVGSDEENMKLSEKRAKAAVDYIISNGIDPKRISGKGYGATQLLNRCKHGVTCSEEENQVNRRTEFKFIKQ